MTKNISKTKHVDDLRRRAEQIIPETLESLGQMSAPEIQKLVHELHVHKIELEMQNEALRKAQIEATEARQKYAALYDFSPVGYFTLDGKGRIIEANVTGASLLGAEKRSLAKQPFQHFIIPGYFSIFQSHLQKAHELRSKQTCKLKLTGKDGSLFDALIDTIVVIDGEGKFDHYRSSVTDITGITRAEEALREAEEGYRALASTADSMYLVDRECRYQFMNNAHLLRLGVSLEQVKGRSYGDFHSEEDLKQFAATIEAAFETGNSFQTEHKGRIGDSFFLRTFSPVKNSQERITAVTVISKDITERKRAEEVLRLHSEILAHIVESVHLVRVDDGVIVYTNQRFDRVFGYDPGELVGKHVSIINAPGEKSPEAVANEIIRSLKQAGGVWNGEVHNIRKDGSSFWCHVNVSPFKHPEYGEVWISVNRDITGRKQAEELLRRTEENFRRSLDESPLGVRIVTIEGETIYANRAILDIYGYDSIEELKATPLKKRYLPESFAEYLTRREKRKRGDYSPSEYDISIVRKDGEVRHLHVFRKEVLWDGERQFQVLYSDITERKQAEEALRAERNKLEAVTRNIGVGLAIISKDYRTIWANDVIRNIFGETEGKLCYVTYNYQQNICPWCGVRRVFEAGENNVVTEAEGYDKDGNRIWSQIIATPIRDESGEVTAALEVVVPITERKLAEEALKASHLQLRTLAGRLQSSREEQKKQIAREIHDELGGALTGLKIDLSFLVRSAPKSRDKTKRDFFLSKILDMTKLIDETIGTVRRLVTELRPSILDDFGLLSALEWQLEEFEKRTGIQTKFVSNVAYIHMGEELSTTVFRIFQESLTNVARHANATKVTATLYKEADSLLLKVEDDGKGISEDDIHNTKSVGLIGMRERALFLGGTVNFSGEPSKGTTVSLQFSFKS